MKMGMKGGDKVLKMIEAYNIESENLLNMKKDLPTIMGPQIAKLLYSQVLPRSNELISKVSMDLSKLSAHDVDLIYSQSDLLNIKQKILDLLVVKISYPT